jgi:hypothetical protein
MGGSFWADELPKNVPSELNVLKDQASPNRGADCRDRARTVLFY